MARFHIEPLSAEHARHAFASGVPALDRYLIELASQDVKRRISNCFIALDEIGTVAGYYTFAATSIPLTDLTPETSKRLPRYALMPAGLIGRLAVDQKYRGQRLGGALVIDAVKRSVQSDPAIFALVVDAKGESAIAFYRHLGFIPFVSRAMSLYLPIATALKAIGA